METINFSNSALSLIPPLLAISLAILTKRELLSIMAGILAGSVMLNYHTPVNIFLGVTESFTNVFWDGSGANLSNLYIILFLLILGVITSFMSISGGTEVFATWVIKRIKTRKQSNLLVVFLGFLIFIDDYFNSLAVGGICRPITDHYRVSRAKLAYLLDSTSAPVCSIVPVSSWGAYIIALVTPILAYNGIQNLSAVEAFIKIIPMSYYALFSLLMIVCVAVFDINIGPMRSHEKRAIEKGILHTETKDSIPASAAKLDYICEGKVSDLIIPLCMLIVSVLFFMIYYGINNLNAANRPLTIMRIIEYTNVSKSLFLGSLISLISIVILLSNRSIAIKDWVKTVKVGVKSMMPAIAILIFAWMLGDIITQVQTGKYMSYLISESMPVSVIPVLAFLISGIIAFSTGTSWGTFSIMLPIAIDMAVATDISILLPAMSAVISGSVFGDHCSPISDTTILSATGACCNFMDHVITQLPYAICIAIISTIGYLVLGWTGSAVNSLLVTTAIFALTVFIMTKRNNFDSERINNEAPS